MPSCSSLGTRSGGERLARRLGAPRCRRLEQEHLLGAVAGRRDSATARSPPNQGRCRARSRAPAAGPGDQCERSRRDCGAKSGSSAGELGRLLVLLGLGVEVDVDVGERVGGDDLGGVVVGRAASPPGSRQGSAGTANTRKANDRDGDRERRHEASPGDYRERRQRRPPAIRPRDRGQRATRRAIEARRGRADAADREDRSAEQGALVASAPARAQATMRSRAAVSRRALYLGALSRRAARDAALGG